MSSSAGVPVPRRGPKLEPLLLGDDERAVLERWTRRANSAQALALRARIVLACAGPDVPPIVEVARHLRFSADTVRKWRRRFLAERLDGLADEPRPGRPPTIGVDQVEAVVIATLEGTPKNATHWSRKSMAEHSGLSKSTVGRIWRKFQLKPHLEVEVGVTRRNPGPSRSSRPSPCRTVLLPVLVRDGAAAGVSLALEGGEPGEVLRRTHPRRGVGRPALQQLRHRGLLVGVDGGGPLRRGESGIPVRVVDGVRLGRRLVVIVAALLSGLRHQFGRPGSRSRLRCRDATQMINSKGSPG
ncbi:helix-turn-helix domain-containing protein [Streptomyces sp. TRM68367]|uniref:helix-turn-helix domain-containing protein n=1 Tax=Streptomyces sp. TRM68367 TaxID=2758415 RepID=UPI001CA82136|nr:helix-turn-helix domain-containing protein [Streptomyces sp. TRM68367]